MSAALAESTLTPAVPFAQARAHAAKVEGMLLGEEMKRKSHSELETMLEGQGKEWARLLYEENLRLRAQVVGEHQKARRFGEERCVTIGGLARSPSESWASA